MNLLLWLIPQIDKFPRVRRFTLGERLESAMLEVLGIECLYVLLCENNHRILLLNHFA
jgi:hypothetical protein